MTLVALTQEPEVKVRLAMIGKWCLPACAMLVHGEIDVSCALYSDEYVLRSDFNTAPFRVGHGYLRCPACIAAHGGAE